MCRVVRLIPQNYKPGAAAESCRGNPRSTKLLCQASCESPSFRNPQHHHTGIGSSRKKKRPLASSPSLFSLHVCWLWNFHRASSAAGKGGHNLRLVPHITPHPAIQCRLQFDVVVATAIRRRNWIFAAVPCQYRITHKSVGQMPPSTCTLFLQIVRSISRLQHGIVSFSS